MDYLILQQLIRQTIHDIQEFIPQEYFTPYRTRKGTQSTIERLNIVKAVALSPDSSQEKITAFRASKVGALILHRNEYVNARQYMACKLLTPLGELIVIEANKIKGVTDLEIKLEPELEWLKRIESIDHYTSRVISDFHEPLNKYLDHLTEQEAKTFRCLLDEEQEQSEQQEKLHIQQENEILRVIKDELKIDPLALPANIPGKPGIKSKVREKLNWIGYRFKKAWERLSEKGKVKYIE